MTPGCDESTRAFLAKRIAFYSFFMVLGSTPSHQSQGVLNKNIVCKYADNYGHFCIFDCQQNCQQWSNKGVVPEQYQSFRWLIPSLDRSEKTCETLNVSSVISVICVLAGVWNTKVQQAKVRCACPIPTLASNDLRRFHNFLRVG